MLLETKKTSINKTADVREVFELFTYFKSYFGKLYKNI